MNEFAYVPMFVEAKTRKGLVLVMAKLCARDSTSYRFFDIQFDAQEKVWLAWYYPERDRKE